MLEIVAKILLILSILGSGGLGADSPIAKPSLSDSNASLQENLTTHRRNILPTDDSSHTTAQPEKKPQLSNKTSSETKEIEDKNNATSVEAQFQSANIVRSSTNGTESSAAQEAPKITNTTEKAIDSKAQGSSKANDSMGQEEEKTKQSKARENTGAKPTQKVEQINSTSVDEAVGSTKVDASKKNDNNFTSTERKASKEYNSTATMEQEDMIHSHVSPSDNDDIINAERTDAPLDTASNDSTKKTEEGKLTSIETPPPIFPGGKDAKSSENAEQESAKMLNRTMYLPETKREDGQAAEMARTLAKSERKDMSPGSIALVTTMTFALAVVFAYVSLIAWRRYLEHKYGRRELLVNELEFDTNDLHHFEL